jgi:hypothetical protein
MRALRSNGRGNIGLGWLVPRLRQSDDGRGLSSGVHWICSRANGTDNGVPRLSRSTCTCGEYWMFYCEDCGECTNCIGEYYMVEDEVWYSAISARSKPDMLCLGCLEQRIGRLLTKDDFSDAPLNSMPYWTRSERFKSRLNSTGTSFHE